MILLEWKDVLLGKERRSSRNGKMIISEWKEVPLGKERRSFRNGKDDHLGK
jgi:hypothetical protein